MRALHGESSTGVRPSMKVGRYVLATAIAVICLLGPAVGVASAKPEYVSPPEVYGRVALGERLVCSSGTWKNGPSFEYEWIREGVGIAKTPYYFLSKADEHKELWCLVTATEVKEGPKGREFEQGFAESINSVCLGGSCGNKPPPVAPKNEVPPQASGSAEVGKALSCSQGKWSGEPPPTFAYQWLREKSPIKSATSSSYTIVSEDETHGLSCKVTATNEGGEAHAESNTIQVSGSPPVNIKKPEVLGTPVVGEALTCYEGTWSGSAPLTFEFRWLRNGKEIPLETGSTYEVKLADEGQQLSCKVTAKNGEGKQEATSNPVKVESKLKNTGQPVISGTPEVGQLLSCSEGTWNQPVGELTLKYQWLRDKTEALAATKEYKVASADAGHLLYCQVTARSKKFEEVSVLSEPVGVQKGTEVPEDKQLPEISGTRSLNQTLTCHEGVWSNSPTQYVFQWLRDKVAFAATAREYVVKVADQGHALSCKVIAINSEGPSKPAESLPANISGEAPVATQNPEISPESSPRLVGESLTCLRGTWKGAPAPTFEYEWVRDGVLKVGENAAYTIASADRGHSLSCNVTARNIEGSKSASSTSLYIPGSAPEPLGEATISGSPTVGSTLTCNEGPWGGAPAPEFTFQWLLNGSPIAGATHQSFQVGTVDRGVVLSCKVTGTNREGTAFAVSKGAHVHGVPPEVVEAPFITGSAAVGQTLTCQRGIWNGKPPPSFTYRWVRDDLAIPSATEATYTIEPADQGHLLACDVIAANSEGRVEAESVNGAAVTSHLTPTEGEKQATGHFVAPGVVSPGVILASLNRQLSALYSEAHIRAVLKSNGYAFPFVSPTAGKLELLWYIVVKGAHGAKAKQVILGQLTISFTGSKTTRIKVRLTNNGRALLKGKKRMSMKAKATFTVAGQKPVVWYETFVLGH